MDQEIVVHELTHGLTDRMLGGGEGIDFWALQTGGMAEGWSDFYALALLSEEGDDLAKEFPVAGYATYLFAGLDFTENYYYGIRRYPYSTNLLKNPLTFKDIDPLQADPHLGIPISPIFGGGDPSEVHNSGEVWCIALFEMWANLVFKLGWQDGTALAIQYVTDGLGLAPNNATFLEARDGILLAEEALTAGENYVEIWQAFAKRGMGYSASAPNPYTTLGVVEGFDLPPDIVLDRPDGVLELRFTPPDAAALFAGDTNIISVRVTDAVGVPNATITVTASAGTPPTMRNNGVAPDFRANDATYTGTYVMPNNVSNVTLTFVVSATNKVTATATNTYYAVAPPPNDNFAKAIKVGAGGAAFYTSNKRATMETNENAHANITDAARSLWYDFTTPTNATVLLDAGGSDFASVLAVYTTNGLPTDSQSMVASAVGSGSRLGAYLSFNAKSNLNYHIAVGSINPANSGTLRLVILPNGVAETNPPALTINQPSSGTVVSFTNRMEIRGSAVDPNPNPSGIREINIGVMASETGIESVTQVLMPRNVYGPTSTNWTKLVGLQNGLNIVRVWATDFAGNRSPIRTLQITYRVTDPPNDYLATAQVLTNASGALVFNSLKATKESGEPNHAGNLGGKSAWWRFTAPQDGLLILSTTNSSFDTLLGVYTGGVVAGLTTVGSNDDATAGSGYSRLALGVHSNVTYQIAVDGYDSAGGFGSLSYSFVAGELFRLTVSQTAGGSVSPTAVDVVSNTTVQVTATPSPGYLFDRWDGAVFSLGNPINVTVKGNTDLTAYFRPIEYTDGFESGGFMHLAWINNTNAGNTPWTITTASSAGAYAARSGVIGGNQASTLKLTAEFVAGSGFFDYRVSSEAGWDYLRFLVDNVPQQQWSGESGWVNYGFPLTAGTHTLEWRYAKDASGTSGLDAAFIDNVNLPLNVPKDSTTPARLSLSRQSDGDWIITVQGQVNQTYRVESSADLVTWQTLATQTAVSGSFQVLDQGSTTNSLRYYRAIAP